MMGCALMAAMGGPQAPSPHQAVEDIPLLSLPNKQACRPGQHVCSCLLKKQSRGAAACMVMCRETTCWSVPRSPERYPK